MFPLVALAGGHGRTAVDLLGTASGAAPAATVRRRDLDGKIVAYGNLNPPRPSNSPIAIPTAPST